MHPQDWLKSSKASWRLTADLCFVLRRGGMCRENRSGIGFVQHMIWHIIYVIQL